MSIENKKRLVIFVFVFILIFNSVNVFAQEKETTDLTSNLSLEKIPLGFSVEGSGIETVPSEKNKIKITGKGIEQGKNGYIKIGEKEFNNIVPSEENYIKLKESGEISEAKFKVGEYETYVFGNQKIEAPKGSTVIFKNNKITIKTKENKEIKNFPKLVDSKKEGYSTKIIGENVKLPGNTVLKGEGDYLSGKGFLVKKGQAIYKNNEITVESESQETLIANENFEPNKYNKNWIKQKESVLEAQSKEEGNIKLKFKKGHEIFNVEDEDSLEIKISNGDGVSAEKRKKENTFPKITHKYSEKGKTLISNDGLRTIELTKDDMAITKKQNKGGAVPIDIVSDSNPNDLRLKIDNKGALSMLKRGDLLATYNKNKANKLEGFSYKSLRRVSGENLKTVMSDFLPQAIESGWTTKESAEVVKKIKQKYSSKFHSVIFSSDLPHSLDSLSKSGFNSSESFNLINNVIENSGHGDALRGLGSFANTLVDDCKFNKEKSINSIEGLFSTKYNPSSKNKITGNIIMPSIQSSGKATPNDYSFFIRDMGRNDGFMNCDLYLDISKKMKKTIPPEYFESSLKTTPDVMETGLTNEENIELINSLISQDNIEGGSDLKDTMKTIGDAALKEYNGKNFEELKKGMVISTKYGGDVYTRAVLSRLKNKGFTFSEINDKESFGNQVANSLNNHFNEIGPSDAYAETKATQYAVMINKIHDNEGRLENSDKIRNIISSKTSFKSKYSLISQANEDLYTSSFLNIYENFPEDAVSQIEKIDPEGSHWVDFSMQMANRNKLNNLVKEDPSFFVRAIDKGLSEEENEKLAKNVAFTVNTMDEYYKNPEYSKQKRHFEKYLLNKYKKAEDSEKKASYAYLLKINENPVNPEVKEITKNLPEIPEPSIPESFKNKDELGAKLYFYDDEPWFGITKEQFNKKYGMRLIEKRDNEAVLEKDINGKNIKIALELVPSSEKAESQDSITNEEYQIIGHRGHSYHLKDTFHGSSDSEKIFYLGSCGSFGEVPELQKKYPNAHMISDENAGEGAVNNLIIYRTLLGIANGERDWEELKPGISNKKGVVFPNEKSQLVRRYINNFKDSQ